MRQLVFTSQASTQAVHPPPNRGNSTLGRGSAVAFQLRANHFQVRLPAPWALQLDDELSSLDLVYESRKSAVTLSTSHLRLENARHRVTPLHRPRASRTRP